MEKYVLHTILSAVFKMVNTLKSTRIVLEISPRILLKFHQILYNWSEFLWEFLRKFLSKIFQKFFWVFKEYFLQKILQKYLEYVGKFFKDFLEKIHEILQNFFHGFLLKWLIPKEHASKISSEILPAGYKKKLPKFLQKSQ